MTPRDGATAADGFDRAALARAPLAATLELHAELGSTSDRAKELARGGLAPPVLVVADRQTAGRGRGEHRWHAGAGSLTFSLLIDPAQHGVLPTRGGLVSLSAAVAVIDAARTTCGLECRYKWPNDVLLAGKKLAGVLLEAPRPDRLVIGIGVNVANRFDGAPEDVRARATALRDHASAAPTRQAVLVAILAALAARLEQIAAGSAAPVEAARQACALTGREITLTDGPREASGTCLGLADDGSLRIDGAAGPQAFFAGSITHF